ncbi:helix-turn-helix domain-containing protein [Tolypothrix sp. VBCCA 56010]|uniref:helix-turn-helix domain-containing protein n=1 Tax=Tolypothrix sp. VBCCA 56010 TaxID=3137731 RepID=UPI003D7ED782
MSHQFKLWKEVSALHSKLDVYLTFEYFSLYNFCIQSSNLLFMQFSKLDQILGLEIQRRRIHKGWSQEYLAEVTGLHRTYISQLERGLKSPSVRVLSHITQALSVTMSEFLQTVEESLSVDKQRD